MELWKGRLLFYFRAFCQELLDLPALFRDVIFIQLR